MSPLFGPSAETILSRGTPAQGRIVGIAVRYTHDDPPLRLDEYAVEANGSTYGIRQRLSPAGNVRLGMDVGLRIDGKAAVIEWGEVEPYGWKSLGTPPAAGIDDETDGLGAARKKWRQATVTVLALTPRSVMLGMGTVLDLTVTVKIGEDEPYETTIAKVNPSHYATHLVAQGSVIPAWVNPGRLDKVVIDWAAGASATPGVGVASALPGGSGEPVSMMNIDAAITSATSPQAEMAVPGFLAKVGVTSTAPGDVDDEVAWETFIAAFKATGNGAKQGAEADALAAAVGVPAGQWDAVQARWMKRISKDMKLGMAFGQALSG